MIEGLSSLPIDVAAEFLVMAAELAHIKSKMLLPPEEGIPVDDEEEDDGDPRTDLVRRLLEYQKYRDAAHDLSDLDRLGRDVFARSPELLGAEDDFDPGLRGGSIFRLVDTMAEILNRLEPELQHEVEADPGNVSDRVLHAMEYGKAHGNRFTFWELLKGAKTRQVIVLTFVAVLEMARTGVLKIETVEPDENSQEPGSSEIVLVLTGQDPPKDLLHVEAEPLDE
jgi:segregation and condensation protein A